MKPTSAVTCALLLGCLCSAPRSAAAQTPREQAGVLFDQASDLFSRGMYLDALKRFRQARRLYASFKIDLNIGATLDAMGRRTEAAVYFERFLVNAAEAPPEIIKAATSRLGELRNKLGRVKVSCLVEGATVVVDRKAVGRVPLDYGLYDMAGNVGEWCHDWYQDDLGTSPVTDPFGASAGSRRVVRGGSWFCQAESLRAANRFDRIPPNMKQVFTGFRVVRTR